MWSTSSAESLTPAEDGLVFHTAAITGYPIRDEDEYGGVRVSLSATLASARLDFHVDVNMGEPIWPSASELDVPRLLGGTITVRGYPLHMVFAEKLVTAIQRGTAKTRWRDFADMYILSGQHHLSGHDLLKALHEVARYRRVEVRPLREVLDGFGQLGHVKWGIWVNHQRLQATLPSAFQTVLDALSAFADPIISGAVLTTWDASRREWG